MKSEITELDLVQQLKQQIPEDRILYKEVDLISYSYDASFYYLKPKVVVRPINIKEIQFILFIANQYKIPITFRTAGTSLSGQAVGNGIVVDIGFSDGWNSYEILNNGKSIKFEPAIIGQHLNLFLRHYSSKIGPDPASINSCMMGGILANNASGMCCGVQFNSYHTLQNIKVVLYNGYVLDTFDPNCEEKLKNDVPEIYEKVLEIKNQILNNPSLVDKIKKKYAIKNTIGYSLNAFIDFEKVSDIIAHLMIGSEGTLGFIAEAELKTIPDLPFKYTGILSFPDIFTACESIPYLIKINAVAVELMDRAAIRSIEDKPEIPSDLKTLPEDATCLLVEFEFSSKEELHQFKRELNHHLKNFRLLYQPEFTDDPYKRNILWKVRKGLFPSVGAVREKGTTVIIEDIAFPLDKLPYATIELQKLFKKHHYDNAIIFGHAKDGNLHFVITQSFNHPKFIEQYDKFMKDVVELVAEKYHGSLKAEHGTGRNMAPFVELEWGRDAYEIMKKIKTLFDPNNILNPGVIINEDPNAHIKNLKEIPAFSSEKNNYKELMIAEKCIECGFCESVCPSRYITSTPRKRIVLQREIKRNPAFAYSPFVDDYFFDTCVGCGLCESMCPVNINTGNFVKFIKDQKHSSIANKIANWSVRYFSLIEKFISTQLNILYVLFKLFPFMNQIQTILHKLFKNPLYYYKHIKGTSYKNFIKKYNKKDLKKIDYYYFPTCISRSLKIPHYLELFYLIPKIGEAFNLNIQVINSSGYCCSQPYESKGFFLAKSQMKHKTQSLFNQLNPNIPIIIDNTSCTYAFKTNQEFLSFRILDSIEWIYLLYKSQPDKFKKIYKNIYIQNLCSLQKTQLTEKLKEILMAISESVEVSPYSECCGFAGDKGIFVPEVFTSSTKNIKKRLEKETFEEYCSSNLTCEIGLSVGTEKEFKHFLYLVYHSIYK